MENSLLPRALKNHFVPETTFHREEAASTLTPASALQARVAWSPATHLLKPC